MENIIIWNKLPDSPQSKRHCAFPAAAEIIFVFNSLVSHRPPVPLPASLFPQSPSYTPFSIIFTQSIEHVAVYMELNGAIQAQGIDTDVLFCSIKMVPC